MAIIVVVHSPSHIWLFATPWTAARQASLPFTIHLSLLKLKPIESVMPSNLLILCHPLSLLPSIFPSTRVFSIESAVRIRWPKYWSFSISPSKEYSGLTSFKIDWFDLLIYLCYYITSYTHTHTHTYCYSKVICKILWRGTSLVVQSLGALPNFGGGGVCWVQSLGEKLRSHPSQPSPCTPTREAGSATDPAQPSINHNKFINCKKNTMEDMVWQILSPLPSRRWSSSKSEQPRLPWQSSIHAFTAVGKDLTPSLGSSTC